MPMLGIIRTGHVRSLETLQEADAGGTAVSYLRSLVSRFVAWHAHHHVAAVVVGMRSAGEVRENVGALQHPIQGAFWQDLVASGLIRPGVLAGSRIDG